MRQPRRAGRRQSSKRLRICVLVYNNCTNDARVIKGAATLAAHGHAVTVVAVLDRTTTQHERREGFDILRIERRPPHLALLRLMTSSAARVRRLRRRLRPSDGLDESMALDSAAFAGDMRRPTGWGARADTLMLAVRRNLMRVHRPSMFIDWWVRGFLALRHQRFDRIHAHDVLTLPLGVALAKRYHAPLVYDAHELYPEVSTLSPRERRVWADIEQRLAPRADHMLTVCESIADELVRRYGVRRPGVLLNCPEAPAGPLDRATGRALLLERAGWSQRSDPIVLYQGGFAQHRGLLTLIEASTQISHGVVILMGWGRLEDELRAEVRRLQAEDRVRIIGPVARDDLLTWTAGADVGVIPYQPVGLNNTYSTPNKLFEYMACGLPIVASRLPELVRFVDGLGIGRTFEAGDVGSLTAALDTVLSDADGLSEMRSCALDAAQRYSWERERETLLALYRG